MTYFFGQRRKCQNNAFSLKFSLLQISKGVELPVLTRIEHISDITDNTFHLILALISLLLMTTVPICHFYFWLVVWSLRKRMLMEIAIGYDENRMNVMTREEAQTRMKAAVELMMLKARNTNNQVAPYHQ